jgi:hypothetical protein
MAQVVLSIPEEKVNTFIKFISDLKYVKIEEKEFIVPAWQQKEVKNRLKKINANPGILISSKDAHKHLKSLRV